VTKIDFIYFDAGGGHRSAALALQSVVHAQVRPWEVRLVNLQDVLQSQDVFRKATGVPLQDIYNLMLAKGWTLGSSQALKFMHGVLRLYHRPTVKLLEQYWQQRQSTATQPDLVVSLVPNFDRALCESLRSALPGAPFVTILTDLADYPPHFWIEQRIGQQQEQYFICGTDKAVEQARSMGHPDSMIFRASGMILRPNFYQPVKVDRAAERSRLGLDPDRPTGLVLFGGQGSKVMSDIARNLDNTQLILICGKNEKLAANLRAMRTSAPHFAEGFTSEIPYYMHLSDFFIGKPGPGSISEAVAMRLPVIVERNAWTLPQERYNAEWVLERGVGMVLKNFRGIREAVEKMIGSLDSYRVQVERVENRAVFEIPDLLARLL